MAAIALAVSASSNLARAECPNPFPDKPSADVIKGCLAEVGRLQSEVDALKKSGPDVVVFDQCYGNCDTAPARAKCPLGQKVSSGIWFYAAPDWPRGGPTTPSWRMCYNLSGKCAAGLDYCSVGRPALDSNTGCGQISAQYETGMTFITCR